MSDFRPLAEELEKAVMKYIDGHPVSMDVVLGAILYLLMSASMQNKKETEENLKIAMLATDEIKKLIIAARNQMED